MIEEKNYMKDKVVVVTVTYNSSHFLERLVESLVKQQKQVEKIIVVDNNSNKENKNRIRKLEKSYYQIEILQLKENMGGAGGFETGIRYALENYSDAEWIWIMDDDAFPKEDCLKKLLENGNLPDIGCLAPMIYGVDWKKFQCYHHKKVTKYLNSGITLGEAPDDFSDISVIETDAFVGPLIKTKVITEIGFPDGELFIYGDDWEYTYRISQKYRIYLIKAAIINHRDTSEDTVSIWKMYYKYRNRLLFVEKYKKTFVQGFIGKALVIKDVIKEAIKMVIRNKYQRKKMLCCKYLYLAVADGLKGKVGKTVNPEMFKRS